MQHPAYHGPGGFSWWLGLPAQGLAVLAVACSRGSKLRIVGSQGERHMTPGSAPGALSLVAGTELADGVARTLPCPPSCRGTGSITAGSRRYMCSSVLQQAMIAPVVWIIVALLDGKCFICAFSGSVDPEKFAGFANATPAQVQQLLAKVPCKDDELMRNNTSRKAVSRYLRCWSQALGWSILLILIVAAFLAHWLRPCFSPAALLQTRYWSNYIDIEQKIFEETCCEHSWHFAHQCILHFFESMRKEIKLHSFNLHREEEEAEGEEDLLRGITDQDQVNELLQTWYYRKPPLDVSRVTQRHPLGRERLPAPWADSPSSQHSPPQHTDV
nr:PREDICTED: calcium homeostasis modulator protein 3-like [Struthio camelus australis]